MNMNGNPKSARSQTSRSRYRVRAAAALVALLVASAGCANYGVDAGAQAETGTITYWMWDAAQLPAYQECANNFEREHPDIAVTIEQFGFDDYWNKLFTGFVANSSPDVFVNHTGRFGEFAVRGLIEPIDEQVAASDIDLSAYVPGSAELWVGPDGKRYGLPKDFDTIGIVYNQAMTEEAGITTEEMNSLEWNPDDGGTYEDVIARLSVDRNGVRGDEEGFDSDNVETYGLGLAGSGGAFGQTEYSYFAATTGWYYYDAEAWGEKFNYGDPRFQASIAWWRSLIEKGFMPPLAFTQGGSLDQQLQGGRYAMITEGSWNIANLAKLQGIQLAAAPTPVGPEGRRTMTNSLGDSISTSSDYKGAAWEWVRYLASIECQSVVARGGVVFPALSETTDTAVETLSQTGLDVTAFTEPIENGETFPYPEMLRTSEIDAIMQPAMDNVLSLEAPPDSLEAANERINALFE